MGLVRKKCDVDFFDGFDSFCDGVLANVVENLWRTGLGEEDVHRLVRRVRCLLEILDHLSDKNWNYNDRQHFWQETASFFQKDVTRRPDWLINDWIKSGLEIKLA